jgi:outer membrane protein OmpA-like peptidoglycan-associated protein
VFKEIGKDSSGVNMDNTLIDNSELVLARPFYLQDGQLEQIRMQDTTLEDISVSSIWIEDGNEEVWLTVNQPLAEDPLYMAHHLYTGIYANDTKTISNLEPWEYGGFTDTSACAHATVNASNTMMVFTKIGPSTKGADLYVSKRVNGVWAKPEPLSSLNTRLDDMYPMFIGDSLLSFSSDGRPGYGHLDIFLAEVNGMTFGNVRHIKSPVNSYMDDFNFQYYDSQDSAWYTSNRDLSVGDDDMYFVKFFETKDEPVIEDSSDFFDFVNNWDIPKIYFEFDRFDLEKDFNKLDELVDFLKEYPKSSIAIEGHTDRRGTVDYNYNLGYKRASEVKKELIDSGVSAGQISVKSKGKSEPQVDCEICSEQDHAKNRVALIHLNAK